MLSLITCAKFMCIAACMVLFVDIPVDFYSRDLE